MVLYNHQNSMVPAINHGLGLSGININFPLGFEATSHK